MLDFFCTRSLQTVPFERTMANTSSTNGAEQTPRTIAASDRAELGAECALKEEPAITTSTSTFGANVSATTLCGNRTAMPHAHQMKSARAHSTHRTSRTTLATARPRLRNLSRSWTHEVRVPDCHNASCRVGVCGGLPSSIVVAWTPQLLARCADLINVEICFWLTRVLHRDQETNRATAIRRPPTNCQGGRTAQEGRETSTSNRNAHTRAPNKNASLKVRRCQVKRLHIQTMCTTEDAAHES